jgi:hypothetical protein
MYSDLKPRSHAATTKKEPLKKGRVNIPESLPGSILYSFLFHLFPLQGMINYSCLELLELENFMAYSKRLQYHRKRQISQV